MERLGAAEVNSVFAVWLFSAVDANTVNREATFVIADGADSGGCHSHVSGLFFRGTLLVLRPMYGLSIIRPIRPKSAQSAATNVGAVGGGPLRQILNVLYDA